MYFCAQNETKIIERWKESTEHKPLVLRGARQVGKTTLINHFATGFDNYLYLNLDRKRDRDLFVEDDIPTLIDKIHIHCRKKKKDKDTLLFIDEIQNSAEAVRLLRYFREEAPWLYVVAAGSLLETLIDTHLSFPVGRVEYMALRPCSFIEFLNGIGEDYDADIVKTQNADAIHDRLMNHFMNYILVGGMPEAIVKYAERRDVLAVDTIYSSFRNAYSDDVQKYARNKTMAAVIQHIIKEGWTYAAEPISFNKFAESNYRSREVGEAFRTIERALLLELAYPVTSEQIPLMPNYRRKPKLLWLDTGLVNYYAGVRSEIFNGGDIMSVWKGRIAEHIVAQELIAENFEFGDRRNYWLRDKVDASAEVDFVYQYGNYVIPIEVKSGTNSKLRSLHQFMDNAPHNIAVRVWSGKHSVDDVTTPSGKSFKLVNIPFYYVGQINAILSKLL
ncbi:MAG: putative ATPase (AAA+ superfamily) [bacterium P3]|nr:MAG: putative ATPase (AAA+ superfamily) [bacterium P3]